MNVILLVSILSYKNIFYIRIFKKNKYNKNHFSLIEKKNAWVSAWCVENGIRKLKNIFVRNISTLFSFSFSIVILVLDYSRLFLVGWFWPKSIFSTMKRNVPKERECSLIDIFFDVYTHTHFMLFLFHVISLNFS